ncbi:MAG: hypothetical protein J6575_03615 [Bifidobacterium sp.]|nr:hypothetical protein [Bifidobacterium sp.]
MPTVPLRHLKLAGGMDSIDGLVNGAYARIMLMAAETTFDAFARQADLIPAHNGDTPYSKAALRLHKQINETRTALADLKKELQ